MRDQIKSYLLEKQASEEIKNKVVELLKNTRYENSETTFPEIELISLSVKKFLVIESAEINYKENRIIDITGYNEAGKTLLLELPKMIWFNKGRDVIKKLANKDTYIKFIFKISGVEHSIVIEKTDWLLYEKSIPKSTGQSEVLKYLEKKGIQDPFQKGGIRDLFFMIKEKDYLTEKDPADTKKLFMDIININSCELIKSDCKKMSEDNETDINNLQGQTKSLESDEGILSIDIEIAKLNKDVKNEKKLKEELLNISVDGADIVAEKLKEIEIVKSSIQSTESDIEEYKTTEKHKNIFNELKEKNKIEENISKENDKIIKEKNKIEGEIRELGFKKDNLQDSLDRIKEVSGKCELCGSEISDMRKSVIEKERQAEIDKIDKKIKELQLANDKLSIKDTDKIVKEINVLNKIVENELSPAGIRNENDIKKYFETDRLNSLQKELLKWNDDKNKKKKEYDKILETDKSERKKELEKKLEDIKTSEIKIAMLKEKKKTVELNNKKIKEIQDKIKILQDTKIINEKLFEYFDRQNKESFPIWLISKRMLSIQDKINADLKKFDNLKLSLTINRNFEFNINSLKSKVASNSEIQILNLIAHVNILKEIFETVPYIGVDESYAGLENNTISNFNKIINGYLKDNKIRNVVITNPTDSALKIDYKEKF